MRWNFGRPTGAGSRLRDTIRLNSGRARAKPMSAEIESLSSDMNTRRPGGGGASPMLVAFAVLGLLLAIYAHWRIGQFVDRSDRVRRQVIELRAAQGRLAGQLTTLTTRLETSNAALRSELRGLQELPAQLAVLGRGVEELRARTEAPQRAWARAEALYLLDLAERQLYLDRDIGTAIAAMEAADARLASFNDPAMAEVRRLLAQDLSALRAVPLPDLPALLARIAVLEDAVPTLPVLGVPVTQGSGTGAEPAPTGVIRRALHRIAEALGSLVTLKRVDPSSVRLVTQEEQSLRRQHLELLIFAARVAAMQPDGSAYAKSLEAAGDWITRFFDTSSPAVASARAEIESLRSANVEPARPAIGAAARQLQQVMNAGTAAP
jgi:uroporphyrin-3 C-methyltransferase